MSEPEPTVDDFVAGLSDRWLHCRELGHTWRPLTARYADGYFDRRLRCSSCRTIRVQVLTSSGHPVSNRYEYPDGYQAKGIGEQISTRDVFRVEAITRYLGAAAPGKDSGPNLRSVS